MAYQNISQTVSEDEMKKLKKAIEEISKSLPFLIALTTDEKKSLVKLGSKSIDFVKDCNNVAQNYPQILPSGFDANELAKDCKLFEQLSELRLILNTLNEKLNDTTTAVGNEAMKASLSVYDYVKAGAKTQAGLKTVAEQLQQRFKKTKSKKTEETK